MPLRYGNPAIDAGPPSACEATAQRGRPRPYGAACDIGAFESSSPWIIRGIHSGFTLCDAVAIVGDSGNTTATSNRVYTLDSWTPSIHSITPSNSNYCFIPTNRTMFIPDQLDVTFKAYRWNALSPEGFSNGMLHLSDSGIPVAPARLAAAAVLPRANTASGVSAVSRFTRPYFFGL
jgi:hypothetical protein